MPHQRRSRFHLLPRVAWLILALWPASVSVAFADGWKVQLTGVKALGVGYAGRAAVEDATVVWFNAAGMAELTSPWTVTFGGAAIPFALDYVDRASSSVLGQPLIGPSSSNGGRGAVVPHAFVVWKASERWHIGGGFNAPYGLSDDYRDAWVGRYYATESTLRVANVSSAVSVRLAKGLSVGLGVDIQRATVTLANRIDFGSFGAAAGLPLAPQMSDGGIEFKGRNWNTGVDLSVAWAPTPRTRLAATYREQITHTLKGESRFDVPVGVAPLAGAAFRTTPTTGTLPMPRELSVATAVDLGNSGRWRAVADVTWTDWSQFQTLRLDFDNPAQAPVSQDASFTNSLRGAGGLIYRASRKWTLRGGGLYEQTPVPDATRNPRLPEVNNAGITVGGTYRMSDRWDLDFACSHLIPHDAAIKLVDPTAGTLDGSVRWRTDSIALGMSARF